MGVKVSGGKKASRFLRSLSSKTPSSFKVGYPEKTASAEYPDGTRVIDVAMWNELGTQSIPPRPFLLTGAKDYVKKDKKQRKRIMKGIAQGKITKIKALSLMGTQCRTRVQKSIVTLSTPENAPSTIAAKGSSNPLVDTGLLRQSVNYEVKE